MRREYEAGASFGSLGRRFGCTRQAVAQKARREGWERGPFADALAQTDTARRLAEPRDKGDLRLRAGARSHAGMAEVLSALERGATLRLAAAAAGVGRDALREWMGTDSAFAEAAAQAQARFVQSQIERIDSAGAKDWRAAAHLVSVHPAAAGEYGPDPSAAGAGGPSVVLNLVLPDALKALLPPPGRGAPVIDGAADVPAVPAVPPTSPGADADG